MIVSFLFKFGGRGPLLGGKFVFVNIVNELVALISTSYK